MSVDGPPASGSYPQFEAPSLVGQILDGRYRITRKLGEGGMGEVYAADHVHIDKKFAIKLLKQEIVSNAEAVQRFRQEARSSSSIGHRNIIAIEDFGQLQDGRIYMCMELLNGAPLNDMIQQPMSADRLLNIMIQTGHGLAAAHAKGIVHRDMKPENIFVTIDANGQDVPKLLDFGIAKVSGNDGQNHLTRTGTIFGTPFYMAPEQALGNPVDARTDIYAMGVIMYECFAGSLPFQGESFMGILTQHITTEPEPVVQRAARAGRQLPMGVAEIVTRCMQKDPAQRFGSMDELVNALIAVYRGIAGPGMSTYMEAFPVGSAQHVPAATPPPMSGSAPNLPYSGAPSAPLGVPAASASGMYAPDQSGVVPVKKGKGGMIAAIVAVLVVGGGAAAFVVMSDSSKKPSGSGSGSAGSGSAAIASNAPGSAAVATAVGSGVASGSSNAAGTGSAAVTTAQTGSGSATIAGAGSGSSDKLGVLIDTKPELDDFEIWEDGKKLQDGNDELPIEPGHPRTVTIKAAGYVPKQLVVDGKHKRQVVHLVAQAGVTPPPPHKNPDPIPNPNPNVANNPGSGAIEHPGQLPNRPKMDCSEKIQFPRNGRCVRQFCAKHASDARCDTLDE